MAVSALDRAVARFGAPVYALHEIVRHTCVVFGFAERGVRFVDDLALVPLGEARRVSERDTRGTAGSRTRAFVTTPFRVRSQKPPTPAASYRTGRARDRLADRAARRQARLP